MDCTLCRYNRHHEDGKNSTFLCFNEESSHYGKTTGRSGKDTKACERYERSRRNDMSLTEALKIITLPDGLYNTIYQHKTPDEDHGYIAWFFRDNRSMEDFRDALTRLFAEYMKLTKKEDGR